MTVSSSVHGAAYRSASFMNADRSTKCASCSKSPRKTFPEYLPTRSTNRSPEYVAAPWRRRVDRINGTGPETAAPADADGFVWDRGDRAGGRSDQLSRHGVAGGAASAGGGHAIPAQRASAHRMDDDDARPARRAPAR